MGPWMIAIFSALVVVLTTGKRDNRMLPFPEIFMHKKNVEHCRNAFCLNENYEDDPNLHGDKKLKKFYNLFQSDFNPDDNGPGKDYDQHLTSTEMQTFGKRSGNSVSKCDCMIKNDLIDLGYSHYPRYLFSAICHDEEGKKNKCWLGSCRPVEYKVRVLTYRTEADILENDHSASLLPDDLRAYWKFKLVTIAAGCFCSY